MAAGDHHGNVLAARDHGDDLRDVPPQPLLKLEPPGRHIRDPGDFAEADDLAPGQVAHADLHVVHQGHVVLAIGKYVDIPHQHQVVVVGVGLLKGLTIHLGDLPVGIIHAREDLLIHLGHPLGGLF